jgi:hypothetical protein
MTPKHKGQKKPSETSVDSVRSLGLVDLYFLKSTARGYYLTVEPKTVRAYSLLPGDILKVKLIEARIHRELLEHHEEQQEN